MNFNLYNKWLVLIPICLYLYFTFANISGYANYIILLIITIAILCTAIGVFAFFVYHKIWRPYPIIISAISMVAFTIIAIPMLQDIKYIFNPYEMDLIDCDISIARKRAGRGGYNIGELNCKDLNGQPVMFSIETAKAKSLRGRNFHIKYLPHSKEIVEIKPIEQ